jgi:hypothetical protein
MYPVGVVVAVGLRTLEIDPSEKVVVPPLVGGESNDDDGPEPDEETELLVGEEGRELYPYPVVLVYPYPVVLLSKLGVDRLCVK